VSLSSVLGTFVLPLYHGQVAEILAKRGSGWVMAGVAAGTLGIALCGLAGRSKELDLRDAQGGQGEFSWIKGLLLSILAGVLSAVYNIALEVAQPVANVAAAHGAGQWKGNVAYLFANTGAFLTALVYSLYLARRNRSLGQLVGLGSDAPRGSLGLNYVLAMLTGTLWYGQFFFYNLGHVRMGNYAFTSWAIHMTMLVLFSNVLGVLFREWKGCRPRTQLAIGVGLAVLITAIALMTYGNSLGDGTAV
jgi:L-rhamnose-H+ transport protein